MVAGRPGHHEGHAIAPALEGLDGGQAGTGGPAGGLEGVRAGVGVGVDVAAAGPAEGVELVEMARGVDPGQIGVGGRFGRDPQRVAREVEVVDALEDGADAGGALGVPGPLVRVVADRSRHDQHGAGPPSGRRGAAGTIGNRMSTSSPSPSAVTG